MDTSIAPGYLSLVAAAAYSGLSQRFLRAQLALAVDPLPCHRVERRVLIRVADLDAWLGRRRHVGVDQALDAKVVRLQARQRAPRRAA